MEKMFCVKIDDDLLKKLKIHATINDLKIKEFISIAILEKLEKNEVKK